MKPTAEQFEIWLADETTQYVLAGLQRMADLQKVTWAESQWSSPTLDGDFLNRARERATSFSGMAEVAYADALDWNGDL